jgi:hypothetical protein
MSAAVDCSGCKTPRPGVGRIKLREPSTLQKGIRALRQQS